MTYYIYILQNKINNKIYVGQTNNLQKRKREHKAKDRYYSKRTPIYHAIRKYGFENFQMIEIDQYDNQNDTDYAEEFWIQFFESRNIQFGYNLAIGGRVNRGFKHSDEFKINKSKQMKTYFETHKPHNYGVPVSNDMKIHLSNMWSGTKSTNAKFSSEQIIEIRKLFQEEKYTQTAIAKIFNTSTNCVSRIVNYKSYKNV